MDRERQLSVFQPRLLEVTHLLFKKDQASKWLYQRVNSDFLAASTFAKLTLPDLCVGGSPGEPEPHAESAGRQG